MSAAAPECRQARLYIGADPHHLPADIAAHVEACAACRRFREETLSLDGRLHAALDLPLAHFRRAAVVRTRRFALAASVVFAMIVAGGFWLFRPSTALAGEVVAHVEEEADSWNSRDNLPATQVAEIMRTAGAQFDSPYPVVYGYPCPFKGHRVAHLVVLTPDGTTMTVMLIPHEHVRRRTEFARDGMSGVLLPAGKGSVALLTRDGAIADSTADEIVSRVHW
ncbi:MAG TPA: DUF3379 family protein [Steroidobacteraceae bacterium]|jgi:hypothetical protein|nr:DUF3379 family protein [Steroidobacteraceae bacterium]